jgi:DNA-binding CsgD family transcriptional regulator
VNAPTDPGPTPPGGRALRGRTEPLRVLDDALDRLGAGSGSVTLVEGAAGLGKSRLLQAVTAAAESSGVRVVAGGGDPASQLRPLGPLLDAFTAGPHPLLDPAALVDLPSPAEGVFWVLQELQQTLERAALRERLLVVVDDVQWADAATLLALRALPARLSTHAVAWLLAFRPTDGDVGPHEALARLERAGARRIVLSPLTPEAVADVVVDVVGARPDDVLLRRVDAAQGHPFELIELLRGLLAERRLRVEGGVARIDDGPVPARFVDVTRARVDRLAETARRAVRVSSVLGHRFSIGHVADLLGTTPQRLVVPVAETLDEGLLVADGDALAFRHDLIREAVRGGLSPAELEDLRRRAAEVLLRREAPDVEVAEVLVHTARPGDGEAIGLLRRAAQDLAASDPSSAASLSRRALELLPADDPWRGALVVETASLLWQAGDAAAARALSGGSLGGGLPPEDEAQLRLGLARVASGDSFAEAVRQATAGRAVAGISPALRAQLLATEALNLSMVGDIARTDEAARRALEAAREAGDRYAEATALAVQSVVAYYHLDWDAALGLCEQALRTARRAGLVSHALWIPESLWRCLLWNACGRVDEALEEADGGIRLAQHRGQAVAMQLWGATRSRVLFDAGRLEDARTEAEAAVSMVEELGSANFVDATAAYALGRVVLCEGAPGAIALARAHADRLGRDEAPLVRRAGHWLAALISHEAGDVAGVRRFTAEAAEAFPGPDPSLGTPFDPADVPAYVRMTLAAGLPERAQVATVAAERRLGRSPGYAVLRAAALHARALIDGDVALLREAVAVLGGVARPLLRAWALEDLAVALEHEDPGAAVGHLDAALELHRAAGATGEAARVRRRLIALGAEGRARAAPTSTGWEALTASELRVVGLVAEGRTNREVALEVHLSPHTVGTHLRHAFAKLGISSRVDLARIVAERR